MPQITPIDVRDKLVKCFINTNKEFKKEQANIDVNQKERMKRNNEAYP